MMILKYPCQTNYTVWMYQFVSLPTDVPGLWTCLFEGYFDVDFVVKIPFSRFGQPSSPISSRSYVSIVVHLLSHSHGKLVSQLFHAALPSYTELVVKFLLESACEAESPVSGIKLSSRWIILGWVTMSYRIQIPADSKNVNRWIPCMFSRWCI
jgi:hypothetical protein